MINVLIGVVLVGWGALLFTATRSFALRASGAIPALVLIAGRALAFAPATYVAAAGMIVIGFVVSRRCRRACHRSRG